MPNPHHPLDSSFRWNDEYDMPVIPGKAAGRDPESRKKPLDFRLRGDDGPGTPCVPFFSPILRFSVSPFLFLSLFLLACREQPPQTGHRVIAEAVRTLLDKAYAGADYPTYRDELHKLEAVITQEQQNVPIRLQPKTEEMLGYLRTADEILRWQAEGNTSTSPSANDPLVQGWIGQYPFLSAAVGAHTPEVFDVQTALILLWDKTNAVLPEFQVKSRPL